jgi:hypothetical protein
LPLFNRDEKNDPNNNSLIPKFLNSQFNTN